MKKALFSTLMHVIELLVIVGVVWLVTALGWVSGEEQQAVIGMVLAAIAKFARASEKVPVVDYVNKP